jgi:hypothetical protein
MKADTPIELAHLKTMSHTEREMLVVAIQKRRLQPVRAYEELSLMKAEARKEQLEEQWSKALEMFVKDLERADRALDKLEMRHNKLRAMELEIETL